MRKNIWLFTILFCLATGGTPAQADNLIFLTEENPPFNHTKSGVISGVATDVLLRMTALTHIHLKRDEIQVVPWARGYQKLQDSSNVILYSMARTHDREKLFQWIGPIMKVKGVLIARKSAKIKINNIIADTHIHTIGTLRESASEHVLISKGVPGYTMQRLHDLKLNVRKLMTGRVDMVAMTETAFRYHAKELGYDPDLFEVVFTLMEGDFYYAASKDIDPAIVNSLQKALDQLKASGEIDSTLSRYQ